MLARQKWISACEFHSLNDLEVLKEISSRALKTVNPVVLLDLDSTLYDVAPRTHGIITEWAQQEESQLFPEVQDFFKKIRRDQLGYSLRDIFSTGGFDLGKPEFQLAHKSAYAFWSKCFFSNEYLRYDEPYTGAAEFTRKLKQLGTTIVYLTGRDEPRMGIGTRQNLFRDSFAWGENVHLIMKPSFEMPDLEYKKQAAESVRIHGQLIASFENEPANLVALHEIFPQAMHVFVDTTCSEHGAMPRTGLYRLKKFAL